MIEKILNNTTPYGKIRASHEGSLRSSTLNVKKTSYMVFGNRHVNNNIKIRINMEEIEKVHVTKFLGVYIDYRLDWKRHIDHIINKVSKSISIIYRASQK